MFFPDPKDSNGFLDSICKEFSLLAFGTQSKLILLYQNEFPTRAFIYRTNIQFIRLDAHVDLDSLIRQVDCYIAGNNPAEIPILEYAWKNRIEVLSFSREGQNVFKNFPIDSNVEIGKSRIKKIVEEKLLDNFPVEEYEWILFEQGLGESTTLFFLLKEFKRQRRKKVFILCQSKSRYDLMLNCPFVDEVCIIPPEIYRYIGTYLPAKNFSNLHILPSSERIYSTYAYQPVFKTMFQAVKEFLEIEPNTFLNRYSVEIPSNSLENAKKIFDSMKLIEGRTIFVSTNGNTVQNLKHRRGFFVELNRKAREINFQLVTNSKSEEIPNVPNIFLPFWESVAFIGFCGNVVNIPTGWIEASCAFNEKSKINWNVIFPNLYDSFNTATKNFFQRFQMQGNRIIDFEMQNYHEFLKRILPANIEVTMHNFSETTEENQRTINKILENIAR